MRKIFILSIFIGILTIMGCSSDENPTSTQPSTLEETAGSIADSSTPQIQDSIDVDENTDDLTTEPDTVVDHTQDVITETDENVFIDNRDGSEYAIVQIGEQVWMAENLKYLPSVVGPQTGSNTEPRYYVYGYEGVSVDDAKVTENYNTYGALYNWPAAIEVCPEGWHLPSDSEWTEMTNYLAENGYNYDGSISPPSDTDEDKLQKIAKSIASASDWAEIDGEGYVGNDDYPEKQNQTGFSALPAGGRYTSGEFSHIGNDSRWWTSTEYTTNIVWSRSMHSSHAYLTRGMVVQNLEVGFSVRCVRD